jgi:ATP-dependent HslUV protease, peptidase subunit HslV
MTVVVAVRKDGRTVLAADSLVNFGGQRYPPENCETHKILRVGSSLFAWAGWSLYAEMLRAFLLEHPAPKLSGEVEVFRFFVDFWRSSRENFAMIRDATNSNSPFADLDSVFLIANRHGIFRVAANMDVTRFEQYAAVGSGAEYALGALRVLYDAELDAAQLARRAVEIGIDFNIYCGGTVDLQEVELVEVEETPPPPVSQPSPRP